MIDNSDKVGHFRVVIHSKSKAVNSFQCPTMRDVTIEVERIRRERAAKGLPTGKVLVGKLLPKEGKIHPVQDVPYPDGATLDLDDIKSLLSDPNDLAELGKSGDEKVRRAVAFNVHTLGSTLTALSKDDDWHVRAEVAGNTDTPAPVLDALAKDEHEEVRVYAAWNPSTPSATLARLAADQHNNVRERVAKNPSTPPEALEYLAKDAVGRVRHGVATNSNTSPSTLGWLAALDTQNLEDDADVREGVAGNPNTPAEVQDVLSRDPSIFVRNAVVAAIECRHIGNKI